jgi:hypothetical protein
VSPDGRVAFEIFPMYQADWQDDAHGREMQARVLATGGLGCPLLPPFTAEQFVTGLLIPAFRQGAEVVERKPAPEVAQAVVDRYAPTLAGGMLRRGFQADAVRVRIRYAEAEEWIFATVGVVATQAPSPSAGIQGRMAWQNSYSTTAQFVYGFRAPAGELDRYEPLASAIIGSIRINPQWQAAVTQVQLNIAAIVRKGVADRAAIVRGAQQEMQAMQMQAWESRQAAQDRVMTNWSQAIRGTATYVDPSGGSVELPDHYDTVWTNQRGEYALVLTPGVNPNQALGGSWTELRKAR